MEEVVYVSIANKKDCYKDAEGTVYVSMAQASLQGITEGEKYIWQAGKAARVRREEYM
jgi:hypothetical protein